MLTYKLSKLAYRVGVLRSLCELDCGTYDFGDERCRRQQASSDGSGHGDAGDGGDPGGAGAGAVALTSSATNGGGSCGGGIDGSGNNAANDADRPVAAHQQAESKESQARRASDRLTNVILHSFAQLERHTVAKVEEVYVLLFVSSSVCAWRGCLSV